MYKRKHYTVIQEIGGKFRWLLRCDDSAIEWFSNEQIAKETCDRLNAQEIIRSRARDYSCGDSHYNSENEFLNG